MDLQVGSQIGDYQVVGVLGAGGMGQVYKVRNMISDRVEAMKVLLPDLVNQPELADRFLREIKVQASLEHPNIAALHTALRVNNQLLMLMELVEGVTLEQRLKEGRLPVDQAVDYIRQGLSALEYAHARGVIHRDIKPANMMLTPGGVVKLMDFGIAKAATDHRLTGTGMTLGSLYYMSPEQIQGSTSLDGRADLYSVGVTLYELVTGKRPFDGDSQYAIMAAHLQQNPIPPIQIDPRLPQVLNDAILMAVAKDPNQRFQGAAAFRNALGSLVAAPHPTVTMPNKPQAPAVAAAPAAKGQSKRGLWMAVGAIAAALAVIGVIQFGPKKGAKAAPDIPPQQPVQTTTAPPVQQTPVTQTPPQAQQAPVTQPTVQQQTKPAAPSPVQHAAQQPPVQQRAAAPTPLQQPPQQQVQQAPPPETPPVRQAPAVQQQSQPQVDTTALRAELQKAREEYMNLEVRASGIRTSLGNMQRSMAAQGLSLNAQFQEPADRMNNFMSGARDAINQNDPAMARSFMQKAESAIERLEKLLNR